MNEIRKLHQAYLEEVTEACEAFFAWKEINNLGYHDENIHKALSNNGRSWQIIILSLQTNTFISLGRILDSNGNAFSVDHLLKQLVEKSEELEIEEHFFQCMRGEVRKIKNRFRETFLPIRHKILAHREISFIGKEDEIFNKTKIGSLQHILYILYQIEKVIDEAIKNKRFYNIGDFDFITEKYMKKDIQSLLKKL